MLIIRQDRIAGILEQSVGQGTKSQQNEQNKYYRRIHSIPPFFTIMTNLVEYICKK